MKNSNNTATQLSQLSQTILAPARLRRRIERQLIHRLPGKGQQSKRWFTPSFIHLALASVAIAAVGGPGLVLAAGSSQTGDLLYPIKQAQESLQLKVATTPLERTEVHVTHAENRIAEIKTLVEENKDAVIPTVVAQYQSELDHAVEEMDNNETEIEETIEETHQKVTAQVKALEKIEVRASKENKAKLKVAIEQADKVKQKLDVKAAALVGEVPPVITITQPELQPSATVTPPAAPTMPTPPAAPTDTDGSLEVDLKLNTNKLLNVSL